MRVFKAITLCAVICGAVILGAVVPARAAVQPVTPATSLPVPLTAPSSGLKLTQVSAGTWTTTVYLNTSALCLGPNEFNLVTAVPYSASPDPAPDYVGGLRCPAQAGDPLTEVVLTFTPAPALSAVPQAATLTVTPPASAMALGAAPLEAPLTVRRTISAYQYVWIPVGCGAILAILLVLLVALTGVKIPETPAVRLRGWQPGFWRAKLYASATWTFGDSWATNTAAVTAVVAAVLTASGTVGGLIPGVDLGRFGLMMALAGGITGIAPLFFGVLNSWFVPQSSQPAAGPGPGLARAAALPRALADFWTAPPAPAVPEPRSAAPGTDEPAAPAAAPAPPEGVVTRMWAMLLASCLTVAGIGAELGIVGWVLGHDLMVAPPLALWCSLIAAAILALLFLGYGIRAVVNLADPKSGSPLNAAKSAAFILLPLNAYGMRRSVPVGKLTACPFGG